MSDNSKVPDWATKRIEEIEDKLQQLRTRASIESDKARLNLEQRKVELRREMNSLREKLDAGGEAAQDGWAVIKKDLELLWSDVKREGERVRDEMRS